MVNKDLIEKAKGIRVDPSEVFEQSECHIEGAKIRKVMLDRRLARAILGICENIFVDKLFGDIK